MLYSNLPDYTRLRTGARPLPPRQSSRPRTLPREWQWSPSLNLPMPGSSPSGTRQTVPAVPRFRLLPKMVAAGLAVAIFGISIVSGIFPPSSVTQAFGDLTTSKEEKLAAAKKLRIGTYSAKVNSLISRHTGQNIAVSTVDLSDNSQLTVGDPGTFTAASTAKLLTAVTYLRQVELGKAKLTTRIGGVPASALLERLIVQSDNIAWQTLNDYLTHDTLAEYAASLGWTGYDPSVNSLLPADMARLAAKLYKHQLLSDDNTSRLLGWMQSANKQNYIVAAAKELGPDYRVYHKAGWLNGLMHDLAIISNGQQTLVLAIYTYNGDTDGDSMANEQLFGEITKAAVETYFPAKTDE